MTLHMLLCFFAFACARSEELAAFDTAAASSVYASTSGTFAPARALGQGSGYWCSSGGHGATQAVSFTGRVDVPRQASGLTVHWAYSPAAVQVLISSDGANFAEAACWRAASQDEPSYIEHFVFDRPSVVSAVTIVMRGVRSWGYFGINAVGLLAESSHIMLLSGASRQEEACVVHTDGGLGLTPCLEALAGGHGDEVFRFTHGGLLRSAARPDACVTVHNGETSGHGTVGLASCDAAAESANARALWSLSQSGQLQVSGGSICIVAHGDGLVAEDCTVAARSIDGGDRFFAVPVPEIDEAAALAARMSAELALKTASRLSGQVARLKAALPSLAGCSEGTSDSVSAAPAPMQAAELALQSHSFTSTTSVAESLADVVLRHLGVGEIAGIVSEARVVIADVRRHF